MVEITIEVPESLADRLASMRARLPEVLAHGLDDLSPLPNQTYRYILEFLVSHPSREAVLNFAPTPEMQERVNELLKKIAPIALPQPNRRSWTSAFALTI